jgi:aspartokinase/homoserine dehydrogenase 1
MIQVLKFGGSSVANADSIRQVVGIIRKSIQQEAPTLVVVSALGGVTNDLVKAAKFAASGDESYNAVLTSMEARHLHCVRGLIPIHQQSSVLSAVKKRCNELEKICEGIFLLKELSSRTLDHIMGYGELISSLILSESLNSEGLESTWLDSRDLIRTDSNYGSAAVDFAKTNLLINRCFLGREEQLFILPGFIASSSSGVPTTLGRGGSDYTASILAAALHATVLEIWTDVNGMMTADPRLVKLAKTIPFISYREAMELSHFGAKVIYPPTIQPVMAACIPLRIKNTFAPEEEGSVVGNFMPNQTEWVRGLSSISEIALLSLEGSGMVGVPGISKRLFEALALEKINVIFITQCSSEYSISVAFAEAEAERAQASVNRMFAIEIAKSQIEPLRLETGLSVLALVGDRMRNQPGISGKMFSALGRNGVNIRAIAQGSSERNISAVIGTTDLKKASNVLHEEFFETAAKQLNLFVVGLGNVGSRLMKQLQSQQSHLQEQHNLQINLVGIANSKKMIFDTSIDPAQWETELEKGTAMDLRSFISQISDRNLRNTVFVDVTANEQVAGVYAGLLGSSISVVACNKIACSSAYSQYRELKQLASAFHVSFLFETNVGASLPIIGTLNDLVRSGDEVHKIKAVLSGTLNFVFNEYNAQRSFAEVVREAQNAGYTEPDPRTDLSGVDVRRKILILAREAGFALEMSDIHNTPFLPDSCMKGDVDNFYCELEKHEAHFRGLFLKAESAGCKLKCVAEFEQQRASVSLQHIAPGNDLYHLYGKDNVVVFYTKRYEDQPLVIKGAGAGADVTAAGIFADIIRAARI